jgi:thymidylate synthase ThyX
MLRKYFQEYESEEDEDYNPTKMEEALYRQEHERKKGLGEVSASVKQLYQEAKDDYYLSLKKKVKTDSEVAPLELAEKVLGN